MLRTLVLSALATFALASSSHAGKVWVNFSGGNDVPLQISLPLAITYTATSDTSEPFSTFVFQDVGNLTNSVSRASAGTLSYTINAGGAIPIDSVANFNLGSLDLSDLIIFKNSAPNVGLGDTLLLSSGVVTTFSNVSAAAPPSGLYSTIVTDGFGNQLGVGTAVSDLDGDYNVNGTVDAADYTVWRDTDGAVAGYDLWKTHFGETAGGGGALAAVPEPTTLLMLLVSAMGCSLANARRCHRLRQQQLG